MKPKDIIKNNCLNTINNTRNPIKKHFQLYTIMLIEHKLNNIINLQTRRINLQHINLSYKQFKFNLSYKQFK